MKTRDQSEFYAFNDENAGLFLQTSCKRKNVGDDWRQVCFFLLLIKRLKKAFLHWMALYYVGDTTGEVEKQLSINYSDFGRIQRRRFFLRILFISGEDAIDIGELYRETYPTLQITICQVNQSKIESSSHPSIRGRRDRLHEIMEDWEKTLWPNTWLKVSIESRFVKKECQPLFKTVSSSKNSGHAGAAAKTSHSRQTEVYTRISFAL